MYPAQYTYNPIISFNFVGVFSTMSDSVSMIVTALTWFMVVFVNKNWKHVEKETSIIPVRPINPSFQPGLSSIIKNEMKGWN